MDHVLATLQQVGSITHHTYYTINSQALKIFLASLFPTKTYHILNDMKYTQKKKKWNLYSNPHKFQSAKKYQVDH